MRRRWTPRIRSTVPASIPSASRSGCCPLDVLGTPQEPEKEINGEHPVGRGAQLRDLTVHIDSVVTKNHVEPGAADPAGVDQARHIDDIILDLGQA